MDCFLLTLGTHGDVEIFRWLGMALAQRGHRITLGASPFYRQPIEAAGLRFLPVGSGTRDELARLFRSMASVTEPRARVRIYAEKWARPQLQQSMTEVRSELARTDYFVNNLRMVWKAGDRVVRGAAVTYDPVGDAANLRKYAAHLAGFEDAILELVALPKALVDPDEHWGPRFQFTGFWEDPEPRNESPSTELREFIAAGPAPVAITMGSMLSFDPDAFLATVTAALRQAEARGVIIGGWSENREITTSDSVLHVERAPYGWLFPRCGVVMHHGGSGTVAATLGAGKPSIVLPLIPSQKYFAEILARHGVLVEAFEISNWNATELAVAMRAGMDTASYRERAAEWSARTSVFDGLSRAVESIEQHADRT